MRPASSPQARPWVVASTIHSSNARAMRVAGYHRPYEDMPLTFPPVRPTCSSRSGTLARRRVGASASRQRRASAFTPAASRGPRFNEWLTLSSVTHPYTRRSADRGVSPVVWEGGHREVSPYPDPCPFPAIPPRRRSAPFDILSLIVFQNGH